MRKFIICDIEATGPTEKCEIIEIALITWSEGEILESYETLVNPLCDVSPFIGQLTSISNRALRSAPKFYEIAEAVKFRLENALFVSHKTEFDFNILKRQFKEMGVELNNKCLCTLKLSQKIIPGLKSYNLDALCDFFGIKLVNRHRAYDDAFATLELLQKLLTLEPHYAKDFFGSHQESLHVGELLSHHSKIYKKTPAQPGLLFFKSEEGKTFHVEASSQMQESLLQKLKLTQINKTFLLQTFDVDYEKTGSHLIAQLRKFLFRSKFKWKIFVKVNAQGKKFFALTFVQKRQNRNKEQYLDGLWFFHHKNQALRKLRALNNDLKNIRPSQRFSYRESETSKEEILLHNRLVDDLCRGQKLPAKNFIFLGEGREIGEKSFVLVLDFEVVGYGYSQLDEALLLQKIRQRDSSVLSYHFKNQYHGLLKILVSHYLQVLKNMNKKTERWKMIERGV